MQTFKATYETPNGIKLSERFQSADVFTARREACVTASRQGVKLRSVEEVA